MNTTTFENKSVANYQQKGEGIPIIFIHGFCQDSSAWDPFINLFPDRNIVRIDLPGFGASEQIENYSIARFADVVKHVLDDLNISECIFIGHSMGGYVGLEFAKKYSAYLKGLCLFHSHPYADNDEKKIGRKKSIDFIKKNGHIYYIKQLVPALFAPRFGNNNHLELAKIVFNASKYKADNIIAGLEVMMSRENNTAVFKDAKYPFLFIIGKEDMVVPDYLHDTALANISSIHVLKGIGHMGMLEAPKKCARIIKAFVDSQPFLS